MQLQGAVRREDVQWLLGSLCGLFRIRFDAFLIAKDHPPPYILSTPHDAARTLGIKTGDCQIARLADTAGDCLSKSRFPGRLRAFILRTNPSLTGILGTGFVRNQDLAPCVHRAPSSARRWLCRTTVSRSVCEFMSTEVFQMFAGRMSQPILRLVGLWQEFQQANIAVKRLGDILGMPQEPHTLIPQREQTGMSDEKARTVMEQIKRQGNRSPHLLWEVAA